MSGRRSGHPAVRWGVAAAGAGAFGLGVEQVGGLVGGVLGVVLAERMLGMEVPERAVWLRTLLAELQLVLNHLMFLGSYPLELGGITPIFSRSPSAREAPARHGGGLRRDHYMFNRVGGLKEDLPAGWTTRACRGRRGARAHGPHRRPGARQRDLPRPHPGRRRAVAGGGARVRGERADLGRASGVDFDLRRDEPYLAYGELGDVLKVVTREEGDCLARFECLLEQTHNSLDLADACLDRLAELPPGPVNQRRPRSAQAPEGHT
ncbi:NADH-quinone oxidoreductase subunit D OS=Streptomyces albaduncus OX=68172 GN=nuoD PE=3 SV=1 [Streptomyces griseoloalbus]